MAGNMLMINVGVNSKDAENSLASLEETLKNISKKDADLKVGENLATEVENARKKYLDMVKMVNSTEGELQKAFAISGLKQTIADIEALNKKISETGAKIKPIELQSVMFDGKELFDIKGIDKSLNKFAKKLDKESNDAFANILTTNLGQQFFSKQKIELEKQLETDLKNLAKDFSQDKLEQYINKYLKIRSIDVAKNGKDKIATSGVTPKAITDLIDNKTISKQLAEGKIDVKAMFQKKATDVGFVKNMKDQIFSELMAFLNQNTDANTFGTKYTDAQMTEMTQGAKESKKQIKLLKEEFIGLINQYNGFNRNSKIELVLDTVARIESLRKELKGLGQDISEINNIEKQDEYKENLNTLKYTLIPDGNDDYYDEDFDTYLLKLKNDFNKLNNTNIQSIMSMNIGDEKKIEKLKENLTQIDELLIKTNSYDSIVPNVSSEVIGDIEILKKQRGQIIAGLKQLNVDVAGVGIPMADYIAGGNKGSGGSGSGTGSGDGDGNGIGSGTGNGGGMTPEEMEKLKKDYADLTAEVEKYKVQIAETTAKLEEMKKTQAESEGDKSKIKELQASLDALNVSYAEAARKKAEAEKEAVKAAEEAENKMSVAEKSREEQKRKALERQAVQSGTQNIVSSDNSADTSPADNTTLSAILTEVKSINGKMDKPAKVEIANNSPETFTDGDQSKLVTTSLSNVDPTKAEVIIKALGTLSKALKDYETVNKSIELPKINGDTAQIDSIIPKMNELTKSLKEFKAAVTGIANSSVIGGLDNLIEKLRNLSTSGKIDLQISNVKSVNEEIDKFSKMVIEWAEAIQIQKKAGANEVERVALFNSKNGFLSNSYVSDKNTEVRDAVNREMLKRYQKEKVDTHIHSHPENIAAFSFDDLNNHIKRLEYGITKNLVVASKEVMKIDLSGVTDKNEYTQFISELQQKIISQMNDFLYNQLKDISANKIANQTSVKYWAKQISNRAIPKSGISINDEILSDIDAKLYDYFNNFINSLHPTNTKSTSLYEGLMETYDNTINELTANGKNSELLKYKDRLYNAISKEILQTFRTQSGIVSEDEYATAQKKFLLDGFRDSKYANVLSVMSIEDFKKNNPALSQITQSQENQSSDNTKLDEIIRELKNISQKMDKPVGTDITYNKESSGDVNGAVSEIKAQSDTMEQAAEKEVTAIQRVVNEGKKIWDEIDIHSLEVIKKCSETNDALATLFMAPEHNSDILDEMYRVAYETNNEFFVNLRTIYDDTYNSVKKIDDVIRKIEKDSSVAKIDNENIPNEAVTTLDRVKRLSKEGKKYTVEYITEVHKLFKLIDKYGSMFGGIKASGAKDTAEYNRMLRRSISEESNGKFDNDWFVDNLINERFFKTSNTRKSLNDIISSLFSRFDYNTNKEYIEDYKKVLDYYEKNKERILSQKSDYLSGNYIIESFDEEISRIREETNALNTNTEAKKENAQAGQVITNVDNGKTPVTNGITSSAISTEVQAASEAATAEVAAFTTIDDAVTGLTGDINAKTDAIKAEAAEMIKAAESEIAAIEKIDNAIVQAKTPNEKLTKKKKDTEYKTETIMPSDTNQPTTQSEVKPEETTQEIYKETEAYKTLSQTLQECDQNFQKIISQDDASEKQFNDKKRQLFSLIGIIKKVMDQCYELGDQNAHFDDLIEYGESLRRKAIEASCDLNEQKAVVEAAHRKVEEEKKATEATNQKANSEISVVDKKIQKQKNNTLSDNLENTPVEIKNNIDKAIEVNKFKANPDGIDELRKSISSQLKNVKIQSFDATTAAESVKETLSKVLDGVGLKFDTEKLGNEVREAVNSGVEAASAEQKPETSDNKAVRFKEKATNDIGKLRDKYSDKLQGQQLEVFKERLNEIDNKIKEIKDDASNYTDENAQVIDKDIKQIEALVNSFKEINNSEDKINSLIQKLKDSKNSIERRGAVAQPVVNNINSEMSALEELKRSGQNLNVGNPAEVQAFIDKLHEADTTVESLQQSAKDIRVSTNTTASVAKLDSKFNDLLFKVDKFKRDNSKITSDKGISAQFDSLLRSIQTIEKSDVNFQRLRAQFDQLKATVQGKGLTGRSLGDELKYIAEKIGIKAMLGNSIYRVIGAFRQMVGIVTELDTGMTTLRRVTEETEATYKKFLKTAGDEAHELGSTVSGLVDSTGDFARLGYNIQEANALAKNAVMYSNVGWLDIQTATADMTSTMKAFNIEASDSIRIVDTFDILGKKLPLVTISVKGWRHSRPSKDIVNHNICVTTAGGVW